MSKRLETLLKHFPDLDNTSLDTLDSHKKQPPKLHPPLSKAYPEVAQKFKLLFNDRYTEDSAILKQHGREVVGNDVSIPPQAVIYPQSSEEIVKIVDICRDHKPLIPIVPFSGGSSLEAHIIPYNGGITINFNKYMNKLIQIYPNDMQCTVQPGINWIKLNELLKPHGLYLGVDPAPVGCIGGMVGTCCSGPSALRYGTMLNQIINLTIVLYNGKIIKTGQRANKSVAGYNLNGLFVGSEGTLGIITEITLKLHPIPLHVEIAQALFDNIELVGECISTILKSGVSLGAFELLDDNMIIACNKFDKRLSLNDKKQLILFKFIGPTKEHINADIKLIQSIITKYTNIPFIFSTNEIERNRLWDIRKRAFYAAKFYIDNRNNNVLVTDVAVPIGNFTKCITLCKNQLNKSYLFCPIVGHIGDGNFHALIVYDNNNKNDRLEVKKLSHYIVDIALSLDGTCTAEHGIGVGKKIYLEQELGQNTLELMKFIKYYFDPYYIFNPEKVVDKIKK